MKKQSYKRIRKLREDRAWPQEQLAEISGVSVRTIQRIEKGESAGYETVKALAAAFKMDSKELADPRETKAARASDRKKVTFLLRVTTGADLFKIVGGSDAGSFDHDELNDSEVELVADFLQDLKDWAELWNEIEPGERVRISHQYTDRIRQLQEDGLLVFAMRQKKKLRLSDEKPPIPWEVSTVYVTRRTNPRIVNLNHDGATLPTAG